MAEGFVLSENDLKKIVSLVNTHMARRINTVGRVGELRAETQEFLAPEVYLAVTPPDGIPALILACGTGTGSCFIDPYEVNDLPGFADCMIRRIMTEAESEITDNLPSLITTSIESKRVYNISIDKISGNTNILAIRDKYGNYVAIPGSRVGTDAGCTDYVTECVNGYLVRYICQNGVYVFDEDLGIPCEDPPPHVHPRQFTGTGTGTGTLIHDLDIRPKSPTILDIPFGICPIFGDCDVLEGTATGTAVGTEDTSTTYHIQNSLRYLFVDATANSVTIYLPEWSSLQEFLIIRTDASANTVTVRVSCDTETINGAASVTLDGQYAGLLILSGCTDSQWVALKWCDVCGGAGVTTVNGHTGDVSLSYSDVGADAAGSAASATSAAEAYALALVDDLSGVSDPSTARTNLGLGTLATQSGTFSGTSSGTNTGDQTITLTGDATGSGTGSFPVSVVAIGGVAVTVDTDGTLAGNSDSKLATQKAVKTYADQLIAANDAMVFKGVIDCSANPNYPAADRGHTYRISVAGKIGGASGVNVEVGDGLICLTDGTVSGNQATVGTSWTIFQTNLDGAVIGPASATGDHVVLFDGTSGKLIKDSGLTLSGSNTGDQTITLTGNVTGSGTGSFPTTIANNAVTLDMMATVATASFLGRTTTGTGNVEALTATQATALLNNFTSTLKGLAPLSGGGTANFLRADGSWATPPGTGGSGTVTSASVVAANGVSATVATATTTPAFTFTLGDITPTSVAATGASSVIVTDTGTNNMPVVLTLTHNSSATPTNPFGIEVDTKLKSSTTNDTIVCQQQWSWTTATHASRASQYALLMVDFNSSRTVLMAGANGTAGTIGFLGASASPQLASPDLGTMATTFGFASGTPTFAAANITGYATQADQEAASSTTAPVSPGRQQYHPTATKASIYFTISGTTVTIQRSVNVTSVTRNGVGDYTINFTTAFSDANYAVSSMSALSTGGAATTPFDQSTRSTGSFRFITAAGGVAAEIARCSLHFTGDF